HLAWRLPKGEAAVLHRGARAGAGAGALREVRRQVAKRRLACRDRPLPRHDGRGARQLRTRDAIARFASAVLTLLVCAEAHASGPDLFGFGPRSSALAGQGASVADGYDAVYENPANLARLKHRRLTLGYYYGHLSLDASLMSNVHADDANATIL